MKDKGVNGIRVLQGSQGLWSPYLTPVLAQKSGIRGPQKVEPQKGL